MTSAPVLKQAPGLQVACDVILNWPERIKTQPHDDRTIVFCTLTQRGRSGMTANNDIDDDSATKHSNSHMRRGYWRGATYGVEFDSLVGALTAHSRKATFSLIPMNFMQDRIDIAYRMGCGATTSTIGT